MNTKITGLGTVKSVGLLILLCAVLLSCSPRTQGSAPAAAAQTGAAPKVSVVYLDGTVSVNGSPAQIGELAGTMVRVETGPGASCQLEFGDKNIVGISQNAVVSFDFSKAVLEVGLKKGGLTSVLKGLAQVAGKDSFVVTTDFAQAGVRGTCFCIWADDGGTYVCACNGTVRTIDAKGSNEQLLSAAHHVARVYSRKDGAISVEGAGVLHHSDASVQALATKIGYTIDWSKVD